MITNHINEVAKDLAQNPHSLDYIVERLTNIYSLGVLQGGINTTNRALDILGANITEPIDPFTKLNPEE